MINWEQDAEYVANMLGFAFIRYTNGWIEVLDSEQLVEWANSFDKDKFIEMIARYPKIETDKRAIKDPFGTSTKDMIFKIREQFRKAKEECELMEDEEIKKIMNASLKTIFIPSVYHKQ